MTFYKRLNLFYYIIIVVGLQLFSCTQINTFEKNVNIPKFEWRSDFAVKGSFIVKDTSHTYNTYIILRHTDAYKYNNIWLNVAIQPPGDSLHNLKVDLQLGTDAKGWFGTGMNDIWEIRQLLFNQPMKFKKSGTYNFSITQIMRDDPLRAVMSAGLRVEKQ